MATRTLPPVFRAPVVLCAALVALLAALAVVVADPPPGGASPPAWPASAASTGGGELVRVDTGWVRGRSSGGHVEFAGIPYAAPPVGERRWAPPQPPAPWRGVRDATAPASPCAQPGEGPDGSPVRGEEDCLYLNVTAPAGAPPGPQGSQGSQASPDQQAERHPSRRPVMVWLHGGGFLSGAGSEYGAGPLAEAGDVVVVTVNYRLGPLGFLSSPALDAAGEGQASGTYGLQDQAAALRWVRRNVARFGGDPGNVTLFGQSSGGRSICAHLASPGSRGLFHKAIIQSGSCANALVTKAVADQRGAQVAAELGCAEVGAPPGDVAGCLRSQPVADVVTVLDDQDAPPLLGEYREGLWMPAVGTPVLPDQPIDALARGAGAGIPLLVGNMRDEMRTFVGFRYDAIGNVLTEPVYQALITEAFGPDAGEVLARYPASAHPSPAVALATVLGDWGGNIGACPTLRTAQVAARHSRVFAYELAEDSGRIFRGFPLGAHHNWDLPFVWSEELSIPNSAYPELNPGQVALSEQIVDHWTTFARTGDPNEPGTVPWARFGPRDRVVQQLAAGDGGVGPIDLAQRHHCDFWLAR